MRNTGTENKFLTRKIGRKERSIWEFLHLSIVFMALIILGGLGGSGVYCSIDFESLPCPI